MPFYCYKSYSSMNVLFICLGNICRSPLAEEVFRQLVRRSGREAQFPRIDSAGMIDYHEGELPDSRMRATANDRGYRLSSLSRPMTAEDFDTFDLIVAMDADNIRRLQRLAPDTAAMQKVVLLADYLRQHPSYNHIPDPYYGDRKDFELVVDLCEDACATLLDSLTPSAEA